MTNKDQLYKDDIQVILSHQHDNGDKLWSTPDKKLLKGAPFTTLESLEYLIELGVPNSDPLFKDAAELIFSTWKEDGRFKTAPAGGMYPCHTGLAANVLCKMGYTNDERIKKTIDYFLQIQESDGGWKCNKYSFGRGEETEYSTPITTLIALDIFRQTDLLNKDKKLDNAVMFLLNHWDIKKPISPCHYGIGKLFKEVEYPFRGYNIFYYLYVLSFYDCAKKDKRFLEALALLESKMENGMVVVERVVPKLAKLNFCKKKEPSELATKRYTEILENISK